METDTFFERIQKRMNDYLIEAEHLSKRYGNKIILEDVNLTIARGETIAFIGNNGSGKSTLLRMLSGLTTSSGGTLETMNGCKFRYIPEHFPKLNFTPRELVLQLANLDGTEGAAEKLSELAKLFAVDSMLDTKIRNLSKGSIQKIAVIQALMEKPDILIMDEPLSGQDVVSQKKFIEYTKQLKEQNATILLSCHEPYLTEQLADRIMKIENRTCLPAEKSMEISKAVIRVIKSKQLNLKQLRALQGVLEVRETELEWMITADFACCQEILSNLISMGCVLQHFEKI